QQNFNKSEMHPSLPCWQTFSCTTASMRGWRASTQASPLSGMPMMPSCTAERRGTHEHEKFTFLGYEFRPRRARNHRGKYFVSFLPAISDKAAKAIREE